MGSTKFRDTGFPNTKAIKKSTHKGKNEERSFRKKNRGSLPYRDLFRREEENNRIVLSA